MKFFQRIEDAEALVRMKNGVFKTAPLYARGETIYVKHGQGFVRVAAGLPNDGYPTSHPDIRVLEFDAPRAVIKVEGHRLVYKGQA